MTPTDAQSTVIDLSHTADRPICWLGGVRSGKTVGACMALLDVMQSRPGAYAVMSFAQASIDRNIRPVLHSLLDDAFLPYEERKASPQYISTVHGKIWFFTASDRAAEKSLQGVTLRGAVTDEILLYPKNVIMQLVARFTHDEPFWIMTANKSNPAHWIKTEWIDEGKVIEINSEVSDNPHVSKQSITWHEDLLVGHYKDRMIKNEWATETSVVKAPGPDLPLTSFKRSKVTSHCRSLWHDTAYGGAMVDLARIDGEIIVVSCKASTLIEDVHTAAPRQVMCKHTVRLANDACRSYEGLRDAWVFVPEKIDEKAVHMSMCGAPVRFLDGVREIMDVKKDLSVWAYLPDRQATALSKPDRTTPSVLAIMQGFYILTRGISAFRYRGSA